jgi:isoquinoline 1-oxidoreductase
MVMADTDLTPFDQGTFGSQTTPRMAPVLSRAAATARELLVDRAATSWQVGRETLTADGGRVRAGDGRSMGYGELVAAGDLKGTIAASTAILPKAKWAIRGAAPKRSTAPTSSPAAIATRPT